MSIATEITRLEDNVEDCYDACFVKGATIPSVQNSDNLADTILTIPQGGGGTQPINSTIISSTTDETIGMNYLMVGDKISELDSEFVNNYSNFSDYILAFCGGQQLSSSNKVMAIQQDQYSSHREDYIAFLFTVANNGVISQAKTNFTSNKTLYGPFQFDMNNPNQLVYCSEEKIWTFTYRPDNNTIVIRSVNNPQGFYGFTPEGTLIDRVNNNMIYYYYSYNPKGEYVYHLTYEKQDDYTYKINLIDTDFISSATEDKTKFPVITNDLGNGYYLGEETSNIGCYINSDGDFMPIEMYYLRPEILQYQDTYAKRIVYKDKFAILYTVRTDNYVHCDWYDTTNHISNTTILPATAGYNPYYPSVKWIDVSYYGGSEYYVINYTKYDLKNNKPVVGLPGSPKGYWYRIVNNLLCEFIQGGVERYNVYRLTGPTEGYQFRLPKETDDLVIGLTKTACSPTTAGQIYLVNYEED